MKRGVTMTKVGEIVDSVRYELPNRNGKDSNPVILEIKIERSSRIKKDFSAWVILSHNETETAKFLFFNELLNFAEALKASTKNWDFQKVIIKSDDQSIIEISRRNKVGSSRSDTCIKIGDREFIVPISYISEGMVEKIKALYKKYTIHRSFT